ncbi:MAG: hypothetical protein MHM6MM_000391 [Cercozoa sp. M6MM]
MRLISKLKDFWHRGAREKIATALAATERAFAQIRAAQRELGRISARQAAELVLLRQKMHVRRKLGTLVAQQTAALALRREFLTLAGEHPMADLPAKRLTRIASRASGELQRQVTAIKRAHEQEQALTPCAVQALVQVHVELCLLQHKLQRTVVTVTHCVVVPHYKEFDDILVELVPESVSASTSASVSASASVTGVVVDIDDTPTQVSQVKLHRDDIKLRQLIEHELGVEYLTRFLASEYSQENIDFWLACRHFQTLFDGTEQDGDCPANKETVRIKIDKAGLDYDEIAAKAQWIHDEFVSTESLREVNIKDTERLLVVHKCEHKLLHRDIFCAAAEEVLALIETDSFRRFKRSPLFQEFLQKL